MSLYVESSALLAWLLKEPRGREVRRLLARAEALVTSELTLLECRRALSRAVAGGQLAEARAASLRALLTRAAARLTRLVVGPEVLERAGLPFPLEPVRSLDALHLASALEAAAAFPGLEVLSLDDRIRENARALGFRCLPG